MLKTISTLLITTTIFCTPYGSELALFDESLPRTTKAPHQGEKVEQPASVEELEFFLRSNYPIALFPDFAVHDFFLPFKSGQQKLAPLDIIKMQTNSIANLKTVISLAEKSFLNVRRNQSVEVVSPEIKMNVVPRTVAIDHYFKHSHRYFLRFQAMVRQALDWAQKKNEFKKDAKDALTLPYGQSNVLGFAWLRDKNGIVPIALDFSEKYVYQCHVPYGDWGELNSGMVFIRKKLIIEPCIVVELFRTAEFLKITRQYGASNDFRTFPITWRIPLETSFSHAIVGSYFADGKKDTEAFIFPKTSNEKDEFEATLIEIMMENAQNDPLAIAWLENYGASLNSHVEELSDDVNPNEVEKESPPTSITPIEAAKRRQDSLYEKIIREQQEAASQAVANSTAYLKPSKKKPQANENHLAKNQTRETSTDETKAKELEEKKAEILAKLKTQGRQKWSGLINVIMGILTPHAKKLEFNNRGSHFNIHIKGPKESAGFTLINPHGRKGGEVPAGVARNLASQLFDLVIRISKPPEK